jgi:hypothetical protein
MRTRRRREANQRQACRSPCDAGEIRVRALHHCRTLVDSFPSLRGRRQRRSRTSRSFPIPTHVLQ